ncbi:MAG: hypothetical protein J6I68_11510 [Butyrivibrio sp.]|uniref:hypothetical protein n=1 Tax=Butyrivibrio sp. TaxID=28121 RepID=UPI001B442BE8|nr:hypothetical protein [Butyrivibrio sp.]MBP3783863.1 hypothetical protein [Butyrivibrio sp.]
MKIYQLEDAKAGVIFRKTSPKLYKAIKDELKKVEKGKTISMGFIDAMYEAGIVPDGCPFFNPLILDMDMCLAIIISNKMQIDLSDMDKIRSEFIELFNENVNSGEEISEDNILRKLLSEEDDSKGRQPISHWTKDVSKYEFEDKSFYDDMFDDGDETEDEALEECHIYHIKNPRDLFKYKNVALAYYYYCHEYYIATKYILDDFLDRTYIDVTRGKEILPATLTV